MHIRVKYLPFTLKAQSLKLKANEKATFTMLASPLSSIQYDRFMEEIKNQKSQNE
jgi:hypothetical protein